jgi:signal transduction histidine kinase
VRRFFKIFFHPILIFVVLQIAWFTFLSLWIIWYIQYKLQIEDLARQLQLTDVGAGWLLLAGGSVLMLLILLGITFLFVYQTREARINRLQGEFISSITHELKSPLASIQLSLETINLRNPPPQDRQEFIDLMLRDAERLSGLIDNTLVAARLRRHKLILDQSPVDISDFIERYLHRAALRYGWDEGTVTFKPRPGLMTLIDEQYMEIVLANIIANAVKYSGSVFKLLVEIEARKEHVFCSFIDQGVGVNPKELKKMFKIFYRSPLTRKTVASGTGMGLFIVRDVIRTMGGQVSAESKGIGLGTTISISLPLSRSKTV